MSKKIIRYRISISKVFPGYHPKKGKPTYFDAKIHAGVIGRLKFEDLEYPKKHTIRGNYDLWAKRFEKINKGLAVLELYEWTGKPYNSKAETLFTFTKDDGIGIEKLSLERKPIYMNCYVDDQQIDFTKLCKNDGLWYDDFMDWFKPYDLNEPMAIIHFTNYRYSIHEQ